MRSSPRGEKSWTQKRKESYRKRYGRERAESVAQADVAVTAVKFYAKLKARSAAAAADVAAPAYAGDVVLTGAAPVGQPAGKPRGVVELD